MQIQACFSDSSNSLLRSMLVSSGFGSSQLNKNDFVARYTVTKNSWRGKYTRIFCIGPSSIATINPKTIFHITNCFEYSARLADIVPDTNSLLQFTVHLQNGYGNKSDTMSFTCASNGDRADLLTDVQKFRDKFDPQGHRRLAQFVFDAKKLCFDEVYHEVLLRLTAVGLEQLDCKTKTKVSEYLFSQIKGLTTLDTDNAHTLIIAYGPQMKLHLFQLVDAKRVGHLIQEHATRYIGLSRYKPMNPLQRSQFDADRLGIQRDALESVAEFAVSKISKRHGGKPIQRLLGTTRVALVERDPGTYNSVSVYFLSSIYALVRCDDDDQKFGIEFKEPFVRKVYLCTSRDAFLAHLLDTCREANNHSVSVTSQFVDRGKRFCSLHMPVSEEIESTLLNCIVEPEKVDGIDVSYDTIVEFFNTNVDYNGLCWSENRDGLFSENREKLIYDATYALLYKIPWTDNPVFTAQRFHALRRLVVSRTGFSSIAVVPSLAKAVGACSVNALHLHNAGVTHAVVEFLNTLMAPHHNHYEFDHESINKNRIAGAQNFLNCIIEILKRGICTESASLVVHSLLCFFVYILCPPYTETTEPSVFRDVMERLVGSVGKDLFHLLYHPCNAICYAAGQLIRVVMEEGDDEQFRLMQQSALTEGGFLTEFNVAVFSKNHFLRDLARRLVACWTFENVPVQDLLRRMLPITLLNFLRSTNVAPSDEVERAPQRAVSAMTHAYQESRKSWSKRSFHPTSVLKTATATIVDGDGNGDGVLEDKDGFAAEGRVRLRARCVRRSTTLNWTFFFYAIKQNHLRADLIWNATTRDELRRAIETELATFQTSRDFHHEQPMAWNYQEFEVVYPSLADELHIGQHYPRLLFESANPVVAQPKEFFADLYHRFLLVDDSSSRLECLKGMARLYHFYAEEIGEFRDLPYLVHMFQMAIEPMFRDRMLIFFSEILKARHNIKLFIDAAGLKPLIEQMTLAHLHIDRPQVHAALNALEYAGTLKDMQGKEKEWYYSKCGGGKSAPVSYTQLKELYTTGAVHATTKVWAQGMVGWKDFCDVPQLRWGVVFADKPTIFTYTEVTCAILDILQCICDYYPSRNELGAVMQPLPKIKRYLSSSMILPHLVQLLLTFDPPVCSRVHKLLYSIMEDNPLIGRLFLTGYYYFSLLYTASDVLPLARMLYLTHRKQFFFHRASSNETVRTSILEPLLPPAMVSFLTHHGPEKFADALLGEYETPEIIWGKDMRLHLAGKIANHISDFTSRLLSNNGLSYQYCPISTVVYEVLQHELFCSGYYLQHLCDEHRYPNWPIRSHVDFLRDALATWRAELEKKPSTLSREACLAELELTGDSEEEGGVVTLTSQQIRKAYFALAARYHPDKNPEGMQRFQKIQEAYEFLINDPLCTAGPNLCNVRFLLKAQTILFRRCGEQLKAFKYAGFPQLLQLLRDELNDPEMLYKEVPLVEPATELCFFAVENVPLNADELQEEGGIHLLAQITAHCFELITPHSKPEELRVKVAVNCMLTFAVSAQLKDCRAKMREEHVLPYLAAKGVAYDNLPELSRACIRACETLCLDDELQARVTQAGVVWHLLRVLFRYDPTLVHAGVELEERHHAQLFANHAALFALKALYAVCGFVPDATYLQTKPNPEVRCLLEQLLTPHLVHTMATVADNEANVLAQLNSNSETPYFYWDNTCRAELGKLLSANSQRCRQAGTADSADLPPLRCDRFRFSLHQGELQVGGVFLRLYKAQPEFHIDDPAALFSSLIAYLLSQVPSDTNTEYNSTVLVITALNYLFRRYTSVVEKLAAQHANTLLAVITLTTRPEVILLVFQLLERMVPSECCIEALGKEGTVMTRLIFVLRPDNQDEELQKNALRLLMLLLTHRLLVQQAVERGMHVVLLLLYINGCSLEIKETSCLCLAKAFGDRLLGPQLYLRCGQFLPQVFLDVIKENNVAQACVLLNTWQQNPELVWNEERCKRVVERLMICFKSVIFVLQQDPLAVWKPPLELADAKDESAKGVQVGGVELGLYLQQPGWQVRKPKEFLIALLERYLAICQLYTDGAQSHLDVNLLELLTQSGVHLLRTTPGIKDYMANLGYMHKLISFLSASEKEVARSALQWVNEAWTSTACVEATAPVDVVRPLLDSLEQHQSLQALVYDTLERFFSHTTPRVNTLAQAVQHSLLQKILQQLEDGVVVAAPNEQSLETPAEMRALLIRVIKSMVSHHDSFYKSSFETLLQRSAVWEKYKDQSHDLFLTGSHLHRRYCLTAGSATAAQSNNSAGDILGFALTAKPHALNTAEPPPLEGEQEDQR